jgi:PAS domain S-box-containing protein
MGEFFEKLFESDFMPHGHCYFWRPEIMWSHAISDTVIALAYFTIPLSLIYIIRARKTIKYRWMAALFATFILGCGATHVMDVINIWEPFYRLDAVIRVVTAIASIGTAILLIRITPAIILMPDKEQWEKMNEDLKEQVRLLQEKDKTIDYIKEFQVMAETIPHLVWTTTPEGQVNYVNNRWLEFTGLGSKQILGNEWAQLLHPDDREKALQRWSQAINSQSLYEVEYRLKRHDSSYEWHIARALPVMNHENKVIRWFGTCTNIHEKKLHEEALNNSNQELVRINTDLDNFIYMASHELKAPIMNMRGLMAGLQPQADKVLDAKHLKMFNMLGTSVNRLNDTIVDLVEVAKVQKERQMDVEHLLFENEMNEILAQIQYMILESNAIIERDFQQPKVYFSKHNLQVILYNLLTNAIKFRSGEKPLHIRVSTYTKDNTIILEVQDNGIGFDMAKKDKVFAMFRRLHTHVEGSGLGLYTVKRIIESSGCGIDAESKIGVGSIFRICFFMYPENSRS